MTQHEFEQLQQGNDQALDTIYRSYYSYLTGLLHYKYDCQVADAEDIFTDTVLKFREKVMANEVSFQNIKGYLTTIAVNMLRDRWKKKPLQSVEEMIAELDERDNNEGSDSMILNEERENELKKIDALRKALAERGQRCQDLLTDTMYKDIPPRFLVEKYQFKNARIITSEMVRCKDRLNRIDKDIF